MRTISSDILPPVLSEDQKQMIRDAAKKPIVYEEDCPKSGKTSKSSERKDNDHWVRKEVL